MRINLEFDKINWSSILEEQSADEMAKTFLDQLTTKVSLVFKKLPKFEETEENEKKSFSSKNKIPKKIRIIMRNTSKLPKAITRTKDFKRYLKLKDQVEVIEKELKDSYDKRRMNQEKEAWNKMQRDPKAYFKYATLD